MSQILIQETKKLSDYLRSALGKYEQFFGGYCVPNTNKRCVVGAMISEMGWDGNSSARPYVEKIMPLLKDLHRNDDTKSLIQMNDAEKLSFEQILDYIEKQGK